MEKGQHKALMLTAELQGRNQISTSLPPLRQVLWFVRMREASFTPGTCKETGGQQTVLGMQSQPARRTETRILLSVLLRLELALRGFKNKEIQKKIYLQASGLATMKEQTPRNRVKKTSMKLSHTSEPPGFGSAAQSYLFYNPSSPSTGKARDHPTSAEHPGYQPVAAAAEG